MVVFTCSHCGDSLQKPKVEKHYQTVCRTVKSLTCVDCLKDFRGEEYAAHTKCITEEERYSSTGLNSKPIIRKGEVKQESWTDLVKTVVDNAKNVPGAQKRVLDIIVNSSNVPRKKNKFINFIKSSTGGRIKNEDVEAVWDMIEQYKKTQTPVNGNDSTTNDVEKHAANEDNNDQKVNKKKHKSKETQEDDKPASEDVQVSEPSKKKRKSEKDRDNVTEKHKKVKTVDNVINEDEVTPTNDVVENGSVVTTKKKKKQKSKNVGEDAEIDIAAACVNSEVEVTNINVQENVADVSKKSKKKKTKSESVDGAKNDTEAISNGTVVATKEHVQENGCANTQKSKRKTQKSAEVVTADTPLAINGNATEIMETKSKKKRKSESTEDTSTNGQVQTSKTKKRKCEDSETCDKVSDINTEEQPTTNEFSYEQQILKTLKSKESVTLEKLQKKVLGAYTKKTGNEASPKVIKKFNKKLGKMTDVDIKDNIVKLIVNKV